jgi:hypothetical protein
VKPLDPYDQLLKIPDDVIRAVRTVKNWVETHMVGMHDVNIYGIGVRFFLSVQDMQREAAPEVRISELRIDSDQEKK